MTKKDYELIAASIHRTHMACGVGKTEAQRLGAANAVSLAAVDLAASLAHDNPRFDKSRFLKACGY